MVSALSAAARRGLLPHVEGRRVVHVRLRRPDLRWPIPREVEELLPGQRIAAILLAMSLTCDSLN